MALVSAFYPGRARCLEQALVLWAALRVAGVDAQLQLGVRPSKTLAHAWVEVDGEVVGSTREQTDAFVAIPLQALLSRPAT